MHKFFKKLWICLLLFMLCVTNFSQLPINNATAAECKDIVFVFARGSGEALNGPSYTAWKNENLSTFEQLDLDVSYAFYELGAEPQFGAQYPAVAVSGDLHGVGNLLGAFVSGGAAFEFGKSVEEGRKELLNYLSKVSYVCPNTRFVLGGYSQGAMLISRVLDQINFDKVIYVATFGDPKLYLPEGKGNRPIACSGKGLSNYRAYVSDCHAYEGVLGSYRPYQPTGYYNKLGTYCNARDIMCSSGMSIADHTAYTARGLYQLAAKNIARRIKVAFQPDSTDIETPQASPHDLLIVFDITYPMHNQIDNYLAEVRSLVRRTRSLGGRVALYTVYQKRSVHNSISPIILEACDFSCTPEKLDYEVNQLGNRLAPAASTGDLPIYMALNQSMKNLDWQIGATKTAVVFTSARPKTVDYDNSTLESITELSLAIDPVNIFGVTDNAATAQALKPLTTATNGQTHLISNQTQSLLEDIFGRPTARLALETYSGIVGEEFIFDASASESENASTLRYDWDLDADGRFELENGGSVVRRTFSAPVSGYMQVRVTDEAGISSTMSAKLDVTLHEVEPVRISSLTAKHLAVHDFQVNFTTDAAQLMVILNDAPLGMLDTASRQSLTLTDITETATLRLVPYSASGVRGESASITLEPASDISSDQSTSPQPEPAPSAKDEPAQLVTKLPIKKEPVRIPLAPDTGYFSERCELR